MKKTKYLNDNISINHNDIDTNIIYFLLVALETPSKLMSFLVYELAMNLDIQEKLRQNIFKSLKKDNHKLTYKNVTDITYLQMVILGKLKKSFYFIQRLFSGDQTFPFFLFLTDHCNKNLFKFCKNL